MTTHAPLDIVILAGGQGKRMNSSIPKVLHEFAGVPLLERAYRTAKKMNPHKIHIVYSSQVPTVYEGMTHLDVNWVQQHESLGTAHALLQALQVIDPSHSVISIHADAPIIPSDLLNDLIKHSPENGLGLVTVKMNNPTGYGRIIRNSIGNIVSVIEEQDATEAQRTIKEVYPGIINAPCRLLKQWIEAINNHNKQAEYYLPDVITVAVSHGTVVDGVISTYENEVRGVNNITELTELEMYYYYKVATALMSKGITIKNPHQFYVRGTLDVGNDVSFDVNVIITGTVSVGSKTKIGANTILDNAVIGENVMIEAGCIIRNTQIPDNTTVKQAVNYQVTKNTLAEPLARP